MRYINNTFCKLTHFNILLLFLLLYSLLENAFQLFRHLTDNFKSSNKRNFAS